MKFCEIKIDYCLTQKEEEKETNIKEGDDIIYVTHEGIFEGVLREIGIAKEDDVSYIVLKVGIVEPDGFSYEDLIRLDNLVYICKKSDEQNRVREAYSYVIFEEYAKLLKTYKQAARRGVKDLPSVYDVIKMISDKWDCLVDEDKQKVLEILEVVDSVVEEMATA